MMKPENFSHESYPDTHHDVHAKTLFGFWTYLLTDFMLFATIFATYAVLRKSFFGGPSPRELFHLPCTLTQTLLLLTCSFTSGLAGAAAYRSKKNWTVILFVLTFLLGLAFMSMELEELARLVSSGNNWKRSAYLSIFFTLIATHGVHVIFALLWTVLLIIPVCRSGFSEARVTRLACLRMFWQFLNVVWIFIFSIVYLLGVG